MSTARAVENVTRVNGMGKRLKLVRKAFLIAVDRPYI